VEDGGDEVAIFILSDRCLYIGCNPVNIDGKYKVVKRMTAIPNIKRSHERLQQFKKYKQLQPIKAPSSNYNY
jgi:hypothetical protein